MDTTSHDVTVRAATDADADFVERALVSSWGGLVVARKNELVELAGLPRLIAEYEGDRVGVLSYHIDGDACEIVTIDAIRSGVGVGRALLDAAVALANERGLRRLWLITTNDNMRALRFYQRYGFDLVALRQNAVDAARTFKPQIPLIGLDGIPVKHELELEIRLA